MMTNKLARAEVRKHVESLKALDAALGLATQQPEAWLLGLAGQMAHSAGVAEEMTEYVLEPTRPLVAPQKG